MTSSPYSPLPALGGSGAECRSVLRGCLPLRLANAGLRAKMHSSACVGHRRSPIAPCSWHSALRARCSDSPEKNRQDRDRTRQDPYSLLHGSSPAGRNCHNWNTLICGKDCGHRRYPEVFRNDNIGTRVRQLSENFEKERCDGDCTKVCLKQFPVPIRDDSGWRHQPGSSKPTSKT